MADSWEEIPSELKKVIDVEEENDKKLVEFARRRQGILLAIIASYVPARISPTRTSPSFVGISEEFGVETVLSRIRSKIPSSDVPVFLLVNSVGGSMSSSYKTSKAIRECFKEITTYVPHMALSGGTLLALTGNKIVMGTMSQLSALDVQIDRGDGIVVSANALLRSKNKLDAYFSETRVEDAPYSMKSMADSVDPAIMEEYTSAQDTAIDYIAEILAMSGYRNRTSLAKKLVFNLPTHGYVIDYGKAKKMGLRVAPHTEDPEAWQLMRYWLAKYLVKAAGRHFIRCVCPQKVLGEPKKPKEEN
jgi:ClpP class serine protease